MLADAHNGAVCQCACDARYFLMRTSLAAFRENAHTHTHNDNVIMALARVVMGIEWFSFLEGRFDGNAWGGREAKVEFAQS